jgi:AcrR family transcriptional regulator
MSGGRPRSADADQRIRAAAAELLAECGYREFSMEEVARRAGVGKQTVYRRWPGRAFLLFEVAIGTVDALADVVPDTGSLAGDLAVVARHQASGLSRPEVAETLRGILADALTEPPLARQLIERIVAPRLEALTSVARRAQDRGELADTDPTVIAQTLGSASLLYYVLLGGSDPGFAQSVAELIARGATRAPAASAPRDTTNTP